MSDIEQKKLVEYGEEIGILVTPIESCGVKGVSIGKLGAFSYSRAHKELSALDVLRCDEAA